MTVPSLVVSEIFGPTVQGEGPAAGERCAFLRLMGCNLACSWCDTPYTWDGSRFDLKAEGRRLPWWEIFERVHETGVRLLVVSGGEPLLHQEQRAWELILRTFSGAGIRVEVETNGTRVPNRTTREYVSRFVVSPKLAHAGMGDDRRIVPEAIGAFRALGRAVFKFVCTSAEDVAEVQHWAKVLNIPPERVWIMPEGVDRAAVCDHLSAVADPAITAGFNITSRLHVLAWGAERGR